VIEALPGDLREVFRTVWYLGLDRESAAKAMGCSVRTLGRMWQEAREQVRQTLGEQAGEVPRGDRPARDGAGPVD